MMAWLAGQVDYLLFLTGLCYVSSGAVAVLVRLHDDRVLAWGRFAFALFALGFAAWLQLTGLVIGDPIWIIVARAAVRLIAWSVLFDFGRRSAQLPGGKSLPWWSTLVVAAVPFAALPFGYQAFVVTLHVAIAVPAAVLAFAALWQISQRLERYARHSLRLAAVGISLNAIVSALVYAYGPHSASVSIIGIPSPAISASTAMAVGFALLIYTVFSVAERTGHTGRLAMTRSLSIVPIVSVIAFVGWFGTIAAGDIARNVEMDALERRAATAAASLESEFTARLTGSILDRGSWPVSVVTDELGRLREANPDIRRLTFIRPDGASSAVVLADSADRDPALPGDVFTTSPGLRQALTRREPYSEGPVTDTHGTWIAAFSPVVHENSGAFLGMLGADIDAAAFAAIIARTRLVGMALTGSSALLVLFFFGLAQLSEYATTRVTTSEERIRTIFDAAPEGIVVLDPETRVITEANPKAAAMLGASETGLLGRTLDGLLSPPAAKATHTHRTDGPGAVGMTEWSSVSADGRTLDIEVTTTPISTHSGEGLLAFLHDATARNTAEAELHDRIALENLVRAISGRFIAAEPGDVDGMLTDALASFGSFLGVDRAYTMSFSDDLATMSIEHEWCAEGIEEQRPHRQGIATAGVPWLMERLRDNEFIHVPSLDALPPEASLERELLAVARVRSTLVVPMTSGWRASGFLGFDSVRSERVWSGERIALISVLADIFASALRRAKSEEELAKLTLAVTQSPAATVITDSDGSIEYVNPRFRELSGYSSEELIGANPRLLKSGDVPSDTYSALWSSLKNGQQWRGEFVNRRKDGSLYWVAASISPVTDARGGVHYIGVQEDITAIKEAERALAVSADEANAANRAKSDFLATMSHEIRTPMNAIIGMGELLDETDLTDEQTRYVRIFRSAGESLLTLINDILDLSKIEAGKLELDPREFDLEQLIEETAEVLAVRAREKGIELLAHVGSDVPERVVGDPDRLRQVLINLVGNAVKFTERGHVLISAMTAEDSTEAAPRVRFSVTDTGIGIPPEKLTSIFDAFTQADSSTTRRFGGTGLGLTISRRLVALMGGAIRACSEVGSGSTFVFDAVFAPAEAALGAEALSGLDGCDILIVDDNEENRLILRQYLTGAGAVVDEAADGAEALAMLADRDHHRDAVLLDLRMPELSGIDVAERLRADRRLRTTAVLIVSSDNRPGDAARAREAGAHALLMKPVRRRDLVAAVRAAIRAEASDGTAAAQAAPAAEEAAAPVTATPAPAVDATAPDSAPVRVLLVEDTDDNRMLVLAYCRSTGYDFTTVEDGQQAVDAFRDAGPGGFDVVLMDMQMPVMDGYEATRRIRSIEAEGSLSHTPIVALTAFALAEETKAATDAGCDEYLTKPIKKATLLDTLARYAEVRHA